MGFISCLIFLVILIENRICDEHDHDDIVMQPLGQEQTQFGQAKAPRWVSRCRRSFVKIILNLPLARFVSYTS